MTRSTKKPKESMFESVTDPVELEEAKAKIAHYKMAMIPSSDDCGTAIMRVNDIDIIGFVSHGTETIEFMPIIYFEALLDHYMRSYVPTQKD